MGRVLTMVEQLVLVRRIAEVQDARRVLSIDARGGDTAAIRKRRARLDADEAKLRRELSALVPRACGGTGP